MPLVGVCFQISTKCRNCDGALPLNRAAQSVLCDACRTTLETPQGFWQAVLCDELIEAVSMEEHDRHRLEELAKNRKGKKTVEDRS